MNAFDLTSAYAEAEKAATPRVLNLADYGAERFKGQPPPVKWLVEDTIPLGAPTVVAAMGDTGKSYKILQLSFQTAVPREPDANLINLDYLQPVLGGVIATHGTAVLRLHGSDPEAALHRRLNVIDPEGRRHKHPGKLKLIMPMRAVQCRCSSTITTGRWKRRVGA